MTADRSWQGTGDDFARVEFEDGSYLILSDDGEADTDTVFKYVDADGNYHVSGYCTPICTMRARLGDDTVADLFARLADDPTAKPDEPPDYRPHGPFVCADCHLTFPSERCATPDVPENKCADCAEDSA